MTLGTPISFTLYNGEDEVIGTYSRARIEMTFLERATNFDEEFISGEAKQLTKEQSLVLCQLIADFYGNKFTAEEAHAGADALELIAVLQAIVTRAGELMPTQINPILPGKRSRRKQAKA